MYVCAPDGVCLRIPYNPNSKGSPPVFLLRSSLSVTLFLRQIPYMSSFEHFLQGMDTCLGLNATHTENKRKALRGQHNRNQTATGCSRRERHKLTVRTCANEVFRAREFPHGYSRGGSRRVCFCSFITPEAVLFKNN